MKMQKKSYNLTIGIVVLIVIIVVIATVGYFISRPKPLVIQGAAEASEYRVSNKVPGRVEAIYVKEGQMVHRGDTIASINSPEVRAKLAQAEAARAAVAAQNQKARHGARNEQIVAAYQLYQQALVQENVMKKSFDRVQRLYDQKVVAAQKYDETKAKYDAAVAQAQAAKSQYDMAVAGARSEDKAAAQALVDQASGAVMEVEAYLNELYLTASTDGMITSIFSKEGDLVGSGTPVANITDLNDVWFTFNVREDYLHGMKQGDRICVMLPALDGQTVEATVNYIAVRESYATWKATKETDMYDAKTFEVRAVPNSRIEGLRPGMSAIVKECQSSQK